MLPALKYNSLSFLLVNQQSAKEHLIPGQNIMIDTQKMMTNTRYFPTTLFHPLNSLPFTHKKRVSTQGDCVHRHFNVQRIPAVLLLITHVLSSVFVPN